MWPGDRSRAGSAGSVTELAVRSLTLGFQQVALGAGREKELRV